MYKVGAAPSFRSLRAIRSPALSGEGASLLSKIHLACFHNAYPFIQSPAALTANASCKDCATACSSVNWPAASTSDWLAQLICTASKLKHTQASFLTFTFFCKDCILNVPHADNHNYSVLQAVRRLGMMPRKPGWVAREQRRNMATRPSI